MVVVLAIVWTIKLTIGRLHQTRPRFRKGYKAVCLSHPPHSFKQLLLHLLSLSLVLLSLPPPNMRSTFILSAVFALATAQSTSNTAPTTTEDVQATNPTPDALDLEGIRDVPEPTYAVVDGLMDFDVPYESEIAMATASAEVIESPLTLFPAATTVPINANGENAGATATNAAVKRGIVYPSRPDYEYPSTPEKRGVVYPSRPDYEYPSTPEKRGVVYPSRPDYEYPSSIEKRAACATQATIPNYYNVNVTSYSSFKADSKIADVANNATVPQGYYQTVKNALGANSACKS